MKKYILVIFFLPVFQFAGAQNFLQKAEIEYEVRTNFKKTMGNSRWADMLKDNLPDFKTAYYKYSFADNKSIYKFDHWPAGPKFPEYMRRNDEDNIWYYDHNTDKYQMVKLLFGSEFNIEDSIPKIQWKFSNENREIAGFNCRKATGIISDSVYVFAFYTDEIIISGGPCSINGLPGMILGLTIPRLYTSWIATKVSVNGVDVSKIKTLPMKKPYTRSAFESLLKERTKDWASSDDEESIKWRQQLFWNALL
ncbi:MAG: GLPGLI family protein [Ferruginibacter sp.]